MNGREVPKEARSINDVWLDADRGYTRKMTGEDIAFVPGVTG